MKAYVPNSSRVRVVVVPRHAYFRRFLDALVSGRNYQIDYFENFSDLAIKSKSPPEINYFSFPYLVSIIQRGFRLEYHHISEYFIELGDVPQPNSKRAVEMISPLRRNQEGRPNSEVFLIWFIRS
jgi:hypothetical protein